MTTRVPVRMSVLVLLGGCLLPTPPAPPRYFAPVSAATDTASRVPAPIGVRLAPVRSPLHLREEIVWRRSDVEFGLYEQRRWTELPSTYVERALARELLAVERVTANAPAGAPVVVVELRAFEEVLEPAHEARVEIAVDVLRGPCVLLRRTFAASRALVDDDPAAVARGVGEALDEVARAASAEIRRAVERRDGCAS